MMKFVVLALCVCAASAATFNRNVGFATWPNPGFAKATAQVSVPTTYEQPEVVIGKKSAPVFERKVQFTKTVVNQPVVHAFAKSVVTPVKTVTKTVVQPGAHATAHASTAGFKSVKVVDTDATASVLRSETDVLPDGFSYAYETSNGIAASSSGTLKKVDDTEALTIQGQYQYISPEGVPIQLSYVADEYGYQPKSDILPVGPPVPIAIARSLEYIAAHAAKTVQH